MPCAAMIISTKTEKTIYIQIINKLLLYAWRIYFWQGLSLNPMEGGGSKKKVSSHFAGNGIL